MSAPPKVRLGTRGSALARWQADWVAAQLSRLGAVVEMVPIATSGDRQQTGPIARIGVGVFTKEIQRALVDGRIDIAVHSLKDLPTEPVDGLRLVAVPERGPAGDVLIARQAASLDDLPRGASVATGSPRRRAQLLHYRPDLNLAELRGNVDSRVGRVLAGDFDAIVLAEAGIRRLALDQVVTQVLPTSIMLPAVGQGALGVECRDDDEATCALLAQLDHAPTRAVVTSERALLAGLRGGCAAPVGAWGRIIEGLVNLSAVVLSPDGSQRLEASHHGDPDDAAAVGTLVAQRLLDAGAAELIRAARDVPPPAEP